MSSYSSRPSLYEQRTLLSRAVSQHKLKRLPRLALKFLSSSDAMGLRTDTQYCGDYQHVSCTAQGQIATPNRTAQAGGLSERQCTSESTNMSQTRGAAAFTAASPRQNDATSDGNLSQEVEAIAKRLELAAKDLGFEMPPNWRVDGLNGYGKLPMDRWLGGSEGFPEYSTRT